MMFCSLVEAPGIKYLMLSYKSLLAKYRYCLLTHPVIILIDNDDGANQIFSVPRELGAGRHITYLKGSFYRIHANLYLVKTPETGSSKGKTCIEDLFDPSILAAELDGKKFDPNKKHGETARRQTVTFRSKVAWPNVAIIDSQPVCSTTRSYCRSVGRLCGQSGGQNLKETHLFRGCHLVYHNQEPLALTNVTPANTRLVQADAP